MTRSGRLVCAGQLGDGDGRGVGGEDGFRRAELVELLEKLLFDLKALAGGFDDELAGGEWIARKSALDAGEGGVAFDGREFRFLHLACEILGDGGKASIQKALLNFDEDHAESGFAQT